jgi:hypothetical protein
VESEADVRRLEEWKCGLTWILRTRMWCLEILDGLERYFVKIRSTEMNVSLGSVGG